MKLKSIIVLSTLITALFVFLFVQNRSKQKSNEAASVNHHGSATSSEDRIPSRPPKSDMPEKALGSIIDQSSETPRTYTPPANRIFNQSEALLRNDPDQWFEEATVLATPGLSELMYVEHVHQLLDQYVIIVKEGGYPTGFNYEVTNALLGKNSKKIALLSQSHPRINLAGELIDQWGTPYFFHLESLTEVSVQSAGPDLEMHTEDDVSSRRHP